MKTEGLGADEYPLCKSSHNVKHAIVILHFH